MEKIWHCPVCGQDFPGEQPPDPCPICGASAALFTSADAPAPKKWRCMVCGQVFEGDHPPVPCPVCGAGEQAFEPVAEETEVFHRDTQEHFVLIGGGAAAMECAKALRQRNKTAAITMICGEGVLPYNRPALSDVVADGLSYLSIMLQDASWYENEQNFTMVTEAKAARILPNEKKVELENGQTFSYDKLLIATGADPFMPVTLAPDAMPAFSLRTFADAQALLSAAKPQRHAAIVGGGILGIEAAVALAGRGLKVTVLEYGDRIIKAQADEFVSKRLAEHLESRGMTVRTGVSVSRVEKDHLLLSDGSALACDLVLVSAGVRSQTALAKDCGIAVERGIVVDASMRTSLPDIYAAGDCAEYQGRTCGLWSTAAAMGKTAGSAMAGQPETEYLPLPPATVFEEDGISIFSAGNTGSPNSQTLLFENRFSNIYRKLVFEGGRLTGVIFYGDTAGAASAIDLLGKNAAMKQAIALLA